MRYRLAGMSPVKISCLKRLATGLLVATPLLTAQAAGPAPVGVGSVLQQIQPPERPVQPFGGTGLSVSKEKDAQASSENAAIPVDVKAVKVLGNTLFETAALHALVAEAEGQKLTLDQLDGLAARIGKYYHARGHTFARAVVPAQVIQAGVVRLLVIEARYGRVGIDNQTRVNDVLLQATAAPLQIGQPVTQAALDKSLLLLSDIPGVVVQAVLKPGDEMGASDLMIHASPGPGTTGNLALDGYGNSYTGKARLGGTVNFINPLQHGDVLSLAGLSSGPGLNYGRASYDTLLNGQGTRAGAAYSSLSYKLGGFLEPLEAHGSAQTGSFWARHPLVRSPDANLYGQVQYDSTQLREHIDLIDMKTDRHLDSLTAGLTGDWRDTLMSGGINTWSLGWTSGRVGFDDAQAQLADAATSRTQGAFSKVNLGFARLQRWGQKGSLYVSWTGQWASTNLDPSQKMSAGGPYSVRAYDVGALSGDKGIRASIEFRYDLGQTGGGKLQALAFWDGAHLTVNQRPWTTGTNSASLSGAGVGLDWTGLQWRARAYLATPVGAMPELVKAAESKRVWTEIGYRF
ncbi:hemin transporter [Polaromonas sp. A23]|nr:hemin transporter [Polaromonas sp. A23]